MKSTTFCKSLLALAIASASLQAQAASLRLSGDTAGYLEDESFNGALAITGNYEGYGSAAELYSVDVKTNLNNNAKATSYGEGESTITLFIGESDIDETGPSWIGGNLRNNGRLYADSVATVDEDDWAVALGLSGVGVGRDVINKGVLDAWGEASASALAIGDSEWSYSLIAGDVSNKGDIYAEASEAWGIDIFGGSEIEGDVKNRNNGWIEVYGDWASGISVESSRIGGDLINDGELYAEGYFEAYGLDVYGESLVEGGIYNGRHGYISAMSDELAYGINLDLSEVQGSIGNEGLIEVGADDFASGIDVTRSLVAGDIYNDGEIWASSELEAYGIRVTGSELQGGIYNDGLIEAQGFYAAAIAVGELALVEEGEEDVDTASSVTLIENRGVLHAHGAEAAGILISDIGGGELLIDNYGDIEGDTYGILNQDEDATVNLLWGGTWKGKNHHHHYTASTINGDLIGLSNIDVMGLARFGGDLIEMTEGGMLSVGYQQPGHLSFTAPTTTLEGDLYVAPGSSVGVMLGDTPSIPLLDVYGTASFDSGSMIRVSAPADAFLPAGSSYSLLAADSIEDYGLSVVSNSALLQVDSYTVGASLMGGYDEITASVSTRSLEDIDYTLHEYGADKRGRKAMWHFIPVLQLLAELDDSSELLELFANADEETAVLLAETLFSDASNGVRRAGLNSHHLIGKLMGKRVGWLRRGLSSGDTFTEHGLWAQALYSKGDQDSSDGLPGFDADSRGFAIGLDGKLASDLTLGLAWSYLETDVSGMARSDVEGHALSLYSSYEMGDYFIDGSLSWGINDNSSKRNAAGSIARSDYDSEVLGLNLTGGYRMLTGSGLQVEPRAAARYTRIQTESYDEKGALAGLHVGSQNFEVAELGAGVNLSQAFQSGNGVFKPNASLMAYHDFAADRGDSTVSFLLGGTPFVTEGAKVDRTSVEAGIGLDYTTGAVTVGVGYEYLEKGDFSADSIQARVRYEF